MRSLARGFHKRAIDDQRSRQWAGVVLIGGEDPIHDLIAITAAAGSDQQEIAIGKAARIDAGSGRFADMAAMASSMVAGHA